MLDAERHAGFLRFNAKTAEQLREIRVRLVIEHHEAGIKMHSCSVFVHRNCIRMSAGVIVLFVNGEIEIVMQKPSAAHSGDTGSDDR